MRHDGSSCRKAAFKRWHWRRCSKKVPHTLLGWDQRQGATGNVQQTHFPSFMSWKEFAGCGLQCPSAALKCIATTSQFFGIFCSLDCQSSEILLSSRLQWGGAFAYKFANGEEARPFQKIEACANMCKCVSESLRYFPVAGKPVISDSFQEQCSELWILWREHLYSAGLDVFECLGLQMVSQSEAKSSGGEE